MKHLSRSEMIFSFLSLVLTVISSGQAYAGTSLQKVACPERGLQQIDLFNDKGTFVGLHVPAYEPIAVFQGWGKNEITIGPKNKRENMIRVQIPGQKPLANQSFFIDKKSAVALTQCETRRNDKTPANILPLNFGKAATDPLAPALPLKTVNPAASPLTKPSSNANANGVNSDEGDDESADSADTPEHPAVVSTNGAGGLTNLNCCGFPLTSRTKSFLGGMGRFGARRAHHRTHGGADLYGRTGQPILAVSGGTVIRAPYYFKARTLAVDVRHQGGFIVRYGEISGKSFGLGLNHIVRKAQQIGAMSFVPGAPSAMLHFELYKGTLSGKLSTPGNQYSRRGDITNPTSFLLRWAKNK